MIYHDQNKEDSRFRNDLENRARDLFQRDAIFDHDIFDHDTTFKQQIPEQNSYSENLFQTAVHLSRIDHETGYDDFDERDLPCPEFEEESFIEQARRRAPFYPES